MRFVARAPLAGALVLVTVSGCLFPEYTFDEPEPTGGGGAATSSITSSAMLSSTSGSVSGGGGEGGAPPVEDCYAPGDEDSDALADCADPDCDEDLECVSPVPVGWGTLGHVALFRGAAGSDPACPAGTDAGVYTGNASLEAVTAACTACGCATPGWTSCELFTDLDMTKAGFQGLYAGDQTCPNPFMGGVTLTTPQPWALGTCSVIDQSPGSQSCPGGACNTAVRASIARPAGGTCVPTGGAPVLTTPAWQEGTKACGVTEGLGGCTAPETCVPRPSFPYEPRICIARAGDHACPAGDFSLKTSSYGGFDDTRDCSTCTCGAGTGGTCALSIELFQDTTCTSSIGVVTSNGCTDLAGNPTVAGRRASLLTAPAGGSCPVTGGGVPSGGVAESDPTTFCCLP
jgi:hypothetical protein